MDLHNNHIPNLGLVYIRSKLINLLKKIESYI